MCRRLSAQSRPFDDDKLSLVGRSEVSESEEDSFDFCRRHQFTSDEAQRSMVTCGSRKVTNTPKSWDELLRKLLLRAAYLKRFEIMLR